MEEAIHQEIEQIRKKMVQAGKLYGLEHPIVLKYSMEIDSLHNLLLHLERAKAKTKTSQFVFIPRKMAQYA